MHAKALSLTLFRVKIGDPWVASYTNIARCGAIVCQAERSLAWHTIAPHLARKKRYGPLAGQSGRGQPKSVREGRKRAKRSNIQCYFVPLFLGFIWRQQ